MTRIFITGSTDGLGLAAARTLMAEGHEVVLHARSLKRVSAISDLASRSAGVVTGDLTSAAETRAIAEQVQRIGRMNVVIHNAGIYLEPGRGTTLGSYQDGRPRCPRRSDDGTSDPDVARCQRRGSGQSEWWLLVHSKRQKPAAVALDTEFQDRLAARLAELAGISLF